MVRPQRRQPPWIKALAEVRHLAPREGWCYHHVQAIIIAIDQYAEAALDNREYFLKKPYGIGGGMQDDIPGRVKKGPVPVGNLIRLASEAESRNVSGL